MSVLCVLLISKKVKEYICALISIIIIVYRIQLNEQYFHALATNLQESIKLFQVSKSFHGISA